MLIKRKDAMKLVKTTEDNLKDKSFNLLTLYKILRLIKAIEEEEELMNLSVLKLAENFAIKDENGNILYNDDLSITLDKSKESEIIASLSEIENAEIQIPDIYFSIDEFEGLNLTLNELKAFLPFVK